jgi:uncharacterized surface protein with fasciclin (FAS1) repeats
MQLRKLATTIAAVGVLGLAQSGAFAADLVDTAASAGQFKTLVKAVQVAGLVDTLKARGPYTVFAPTDEAFAKLPPGTLDALLADPQKLASVLKYHVVSGKVMAKDVKTGSVKTVEGQPLRVVASGNGVTVNDATVVTTDIEASNGVIHVIDRVVLPN